MKIFFVWFLIFMATHCPVKMEKGDLLSPGINSPNVPSRLMLDGRIWMTENLNLDVPGSYCQKDDPHNCNWYGHLYTWEAAKTGCKKLGEEWQLPTNEEWQTLAQSYGGIYQDSGDNGRKAYISLKEGGDAKFNALPGGNRETSGIYARLEAHGFYWTATELDSARAWFYNFAQESTLLNRHTGSKELALSVRCIQKIEK